LGETTIHQQRSLKRYSSLKKHHQRTIS
jgi:hypothetical protein